MASVSQDEPADDFEGAIASARQDLQLAIAKAHLTDDPLGVALHAMSETLGAQAALYKATFNKYRDISADLDRARSDAVEAGRLELEGQKAGIVQELAPTPEADRFAGEGSGTHGQAQDAAHGGRHCRSARHHGGLCRIRHGLEKRQDERSLRQGGTVRGATGAWPGR
ncbi:hypothetical protein [Novacetimonas hansenii]|uniref:hypothetical protein n=1 Tax=Novacetimonas hansenii TaxID=436 RepID=UPI0023DD221B|nr:hypothetical protein [Novacetimonas hansenii]WEQ60553.1 hypothetical protein LV563_15190 [Novacetimonas hansenii]